MATTWGAVKRKPFVIPALEKRRQERLIREKVLQTARMQRLLAMSREQRRAAAMESRRRWISTLPNHKQREILLSKKERLFNARRSKARWLAKNPPKNPPKIIRKPLIYRKNRERLWTDNDKWWLKKDKFGELMFPEEFYEKTGYAMPDHLKWRLGYRN